MRKEKEEEIDSQMLKNLPRVLRKFYEIKKECEEETDGSPSKTN